MWLALLVACGAGGCGERQATDYVPPADTARQALTMVLEAWKNGAMADPAGSVGGVTVRGMDERFSPEKRLESYEILEGLPAQGVEPKKFRVRVTAAGRPMPEEVIYLVVGINPLQIFREPDYQRIFSMEK
jgi:hypothetical protein